MQWFYSHFNYVLSVLLLVVGLYTILSSQNLFKKLLGLSVFQVSISLFYISVGKVTGGTAPILIDDPTGREVLYSNPIPHVLILTAIVVGVATLSLGLALLVRIHNAYGTIEEDEINAKDIGTQ